MKKSNLIILSLVIVLVSIFSVAALTQEMSNKKVTNTDKSVVEIVKPEDIKTKNNIKVDADYTDYSISFEEMKSKAVIIVEATVSEQIQYSEMSVLSTLNIEKSLKGKVYNKVRLFQFGTIDDSSVLKSGQRYILFLGKQTDDQEDTYFITGGSQGIINITDNVMNSKDPVMEKELDKYKNKEDSLKLFKQEIMK